MPRTALQLAVRLCAWASMAAIALLSLLPSDAIVRTGGGGKLEHVAAYLGASFLIATAYGTRARVIGGLVICAGVLECLQAFSPGRTPSIVDFVFSSSGVVLGVALTRSIGWGIQHRRPMGSPPGTD
jgi:hypothetical protein